MAAVKKELLPGFDPVRVYVSLLERRLSACAVVLADLSGGASLIGIKWIKPALESAAAGGVAALQDITQPAHEAKPAERALGALCDAAALGAGLVAGLALVERRIAARSHVSPHKKQRTRQHA